MFENIFNEKRTKLSRYSSDLGFKINLSRYEPCAGQILVFVCSFCTKFFLTKTIMALLVAAELFTFMIKVNLTTFFERKDS